MRTLVMAAFSFSNCSIISLRLSSRRTVRKRGERRKVSEREKEGGGKERKETKLTLSSLVAVKNQPQK